VGVKTLIESFHYPRRGPGMLWEAAARKFESQGGRLAMGHAAHTLAYDAAAQRWSVGTIDADGRPRCFVARHVICTAPTREQIRGARVVRQPKAYPVYDDHYRDIVERVKADLAAHFPNLHLVGRNGMHKYNNQDHAMMTAMLTVRNVVAGHALHDVWAVNEDAEYHEDGKRPANGASGMRAVPSRTARRKET